MIREAIAAGRFYPGTAKQLTAMIDTMVDERAQPDDVTGLLVPHAGYIYSGPVAGAVYSRIKFKDTFVIMGPNHTGRGQPFSIMTEGKWATPLGEVAIDAELAGEILAASSHLEEDSLAHQYEHSIEVQLPFLQYFKPDIRIVPIILTSAAGSVYREIGKAIASAIRKTGREAVIVASSDMTHYEPHDTAREKDTQAIDAILELNADRLLQRVAKLDISMCGFAPAACLITAARELGAKGAELFKYQTSGDASGDYGSVVGYAGIIIRATGMHPLVKLARQAVEGYVRDGKTIQPPDRLTPEMKEKAGVFVSIHKLGSLRGCIGTFEPQQGNVAAEVIRNAVSSATRDPRFSPVEPEELGQLSYSVDVLTHPEPVTDLSQLDPQRYGIIVESGYRRGLLLPDLEGVDSVDYQIDICRQKAGIDRDEPVKLYRFEVKRHK